MYNKYYLIILVTFLIILLINYIYYIKNKSIEKFEDKQAVCTAEAENKFLKSATDHFCDNVCFFGRKDRENLDQATKICVQKCPKFARNRLIQSANLGVDLVLKNFYKSQKDKNTEARLKLKGVIDKQEEENNKIKEILGDSCTDTQLQNISDDMKQDEYLDWVKMGDAPTQYSIDGKIEDICSSDKNYINTNTNPHFKMSEFNDLIDQHSIVGLYWKYLSQLSQFNTDGFTEITSDYIVDNIRDKIANNKPLTFKKSERANFFSGSTVAIPTDSYIIVDNSIYIPYTSATLPVWLYTDKDVIKLRERMIAAHENKLADLGPFIDDCAYTNTAIEEIGNTFTADGVNWGKIGSADDEYSLISLYNNAVASKTKAQTDCEYTNTAIEEIGNTFTADGVNWGKIGSADNEYSLISQYNNAVSQQNTKCLIPGILANDITSLPNTLVNPLTQDQFGKYSILPNGDKYDPDRYTYPYIDMNNLEGNINDMCFVKNDNKNDASGNPRWGKKIKDGGEYGLIGDWRGYLEAGPGAEKRYGKIKTPTNNGDSGKIGTQTGEYAKVGFTYDNPSGLRWVEFIPNDEQKSNGDNIITNQKLSLTLTLSSKILFIKRSQKHSIH